MLDFLGEVGVFFSGMWIALALAAIASRCAPGVGKGILLAIGVVFLLLQGGCTFYLVMLGGIAGGTPEPAIPGLLTLLGAFAFLFIATKPYKRTSPTSEKPNITGSDPEDVSKPPKM